MCGGVCVCSWHDWIVEMTELYQDLRTSCWPVLLLASQDIVSPHISDTARLAELVPPPSCCEPGNRECFVWNLALHFQLWALEGLWGDVWEASLCLGWPVTHRRRPQFLFGWWLLPQWQRSCHRTFYIISVCALFSGEILSKALLQVWSGGSQAGFVEISSWLDWQQIKGFLPVLFTWNWVGRDTAKIQFLFSSTLLCVTELWLPGDPNITELSNFCSGKLSLSLLLNLDAGF